MAYGPYCSIVQSSGMGKSRLLDEFSKTHILIPINLRRNEAGGFPPPDDAIRNLLTQSDKNGMLKFLIVLFQMTTRVITNKLKEADSRSERIRRFREFMREGETMASVGEKRRKFYNEIALAVVARMTSEPNYQDVGEALEALRTSLGPPTDYSPAPDVFIAFDEVHSLTEPDASRTCFIDLQSALHKLKNVSFFSFFVSTTSKISQFAIPGDMDPSNGMHDEELIPPVTFSDLGFDHLMHDRKIFDRYKTIEDVTSTECIVHMGRPLQVRLTLDINGTTDGLTRILDMSDKAQVQISNFMHVCVAIPEGFGAVRGVAASEPILSEAASLIMRNNPNFNLPDALINVLESYTISHGDQGELLVAAFFAQARDMYAQQTRHKHFPHDPTRFCPIFLVKDLLSNLFHEEHFSTMLDSLPSVRRADFPSRKFGDVFGKTKMHFNHMIQPFNDTSIDHPYLVSIMAHGVAVLGASCQPDFDMVYPYLFDTSDLVINKVGFIVIRVKNNLTLDDDHFKMMDPILCGNGRPQFTSYDFWCSGIGPDLLQPVDEDDAQTKWVTLLSKTDRSDRLFSTSNAPDLRRSHLPGGGDNEGHYGAWMMSNIPLDSV
ncbi:hypothetical protein EDB89DRAFT_2239238, partial [Lactarius sanguifluus]